MERCRTECINVIACKLKIDSLQLAKAALISQTSDRTALSELRRSGDSAELLDIAEKLVAVASMDQVDHLDSGIKLVEKLKEDMIKVCRTGSIVVDDLNTIAAHCGGLDLDAARDLHSFLASD